MQLPWPWQCWRSHDVESVLTEETKFFWLLGWKDEDRGERPSLVLFPKEAEFVFGPEETENVVITIHIIDTYCCYHHRNFSTMHVSYYCALWVTRARLEDFKKFYMPSQNSQSCSSDWSKQSTRPSQILLLLIHLLPSRQDSCPEGQLRRGAQEVALTAEKPRPHLHIWPPG